MEIGLLRWRASSEDRALHVESIARAAGGSSPQELIIVEEPEPAWDGWELILSETATLCGDFVPATVFAPTGYEFGATPEAALRSISAFSANGASVFLRRPGSDDFWNCTADSSFLSMMADTLGAIIPHRIAATDAVRLQKTGRRRALRIAPEKYEAIKSDLRSSELPLRRIAASHDVALNTVQRVRDQLKAEREAASATIYRERPDEALQRIRDRARKAEEQHERNWL